MKRTLVLVLVAAALAGCSPKPTAKPPAPIVTPEARPADTAQPQPKPVEPAAPIGGPIYLLATPSGTPLWAGPAAVAVENSHQARPQSGLMQADLVVESLTESEITRMLAFYWTRPVAKIGPVRSARTFFVAMAGAYHAPYAHSGGNDDALLLLKQTWGARNLDEIYTAGGYFVRSKDREAPHNLYTSTDLLGRAITERKLEMKSVPTTARAPEPAPAGEIVSKIEIDWHRLHTLSWDWDGKAYRRTETDLDTTAAHLSDTGEPISVPNVVLLEAGGVNNGPELGWTLNMTRGGKATVISGGQQWTGTWTLGDGGFSLMPDGGAKVQPFLPGGLWVEMITNQSSFKISKSNG